MFHVSFKVSEDNLATVLAALEGVAESFSVTAENGSEVTPYVATIEEVTIPPKVPRKKRVVKGHRNYGTQRDRARFLLLQPGTQPFRVATILQAAAGYGVRNSAIYDAIRVGLADGTLKRLDHGLYQRTSSLGLAQVS